ncbi:MAG: alpha/beta fold hydrolase [Chthoniobacteraceae bacterium]
MRLVAFIAKTLARLDPPAIARDPTLPPVVLVHGIFSSGDDMERLARHLRSQAREVFQPTLTPNGGHAPIEDLARQLADFVSEKVGARRFDLIGFSMGGLISRYYLQRLGGIAQITRFISIATPHHGTHMARLGGLPGWLQMRPGSEFLRDLASDADVLRAVPFTSFYTPLDTIIVPARSSEMPQARNIRIWAAMHPSFILQRRCIRAVASALRD